MKLLLVLVLFLMVACHDVVDFPYTVVGKYQYSDNTCMLYMKHSGGNTVSITTATEENCKYNIGDVIK